jgi:hypothetical protein
MADKPTAFRDEGDSYATADFAGIDLDVLIAASGVETFDCGTQRGSVVGLILSDGEDVVNFAGWERLMLRHEGDAYDAPTFKLRLRPRRQA